MTELNETDVIDISGISSNIEDIESIKQTEDIKMVERPISLTNARMKDESWDDYKLRRIQIKKWNKQVKFYKSSGDDNRKKRRDLNKGKLKFTKPLHNVRGKWMVGLVNVTRAIRYSIPLHYYLRVASMGLNTNELLKLGKDITEGHKDGTISDRNPK